MTERDILAAIEASIAVVRPGQALIVRLDPGDESWEVVAEQLAQASAGTGIPMILVVAPQIMVADLTVPLEIDAEPPFS